MRPKPIGYTHLTPSMFHILLSLSEGERHGYAIMQDVSVHSGGRVVIGAGTLYGCLKRMLVAGWVSESDERPDPKLDDERRRYYRLTERGLSLLKTEAERIEALVNNSAMKRVLTTDPFGGSVK